MPHGTSGGAPFWNGSKPQSSHDRDERIELGQCRRCGAGCPYRLCASCLREKEIWDQELTPGAIWGRLWRLGDFYGIDLLCMPLEPLVDWLKDHGLEELARGVVETRKG